MLLNSILKRCCISTLSTILFHSHTLSFGKGDCLVTSLLTSGNAVNCQCTSHIHTCICTHTQINTSKKIRTRICCMYTEVSRLVVHNSFTLIQLHTLKNTQRKLYILYVHVLTEYDAYTPFLQPECTDLLQAGPQVCIVSSSTGDAIFPRSPFASKH